jgi:hypothetical protein
LTPVETFTPSKPAAGALANTSTGFKNRLAISAGLVQKWPERQIVSF